MNQKISHKISGHKDEQNLSDFGTRKYSRNIIQIQCFVSITRLILTHPSVSMQHESMPHLMRLKLLMIFMGSLSLSLSRHSPWLSRPPVRASDCNTCTDRKEALSDSASLLSWEVWAIHPWHWTNLFTPPCPIVTCQARQAPMVAQIWMSDIYCHLSQIKANQTPHLHHLHQRQLLSLSLSDSAYIIVMEIFMASCNISLYSIILPSWLTIWQCTNYFTPHWWQ